jgi:hypothetical protein
MALILRHCFAPLRAQSDGKVVQGDRRKKGVRGESKEATQEVCYGERGALHRLWPANAGP